MESNKYAVIGERRKSKTRERIGGLLLLMFSQYINSSRKSCRAYNVEAIRKNIGVSFESMKKNIGFLIGKEKGKAYIELDKKYFPIIFEVEKVFVRLSELSPDEQKVAQLVFLNMVKNGK